MAVFAWKEDYKSMKLRIYKYKGYESNARALFYDQCSPELKNKLDGTEQKATMEQRQRVPTMWLNYEL